MKFHIDDEVHVYYANTKSSLEGRVVGVQERDDGLYYSISLSFESKPNTLTLIISEDQLELTPSAQFDKVLKTL